MQTGNHTWNWSKKGGCRQGRLLGTGGRRLDEDMEAYLELEEEGWMQAGKVTSTWRKKVGCKQGSILGTRGRRVNADR
jgi:hypothetical protein